MMGKTELKENLYVETDMQGGFERREAKLDNQRRRKKNTG